MTLKYLDSAWYLTNTDYWFSYEWIDGRPGKAYLDSCFTKSKILSAVSNLIDSIYHFRLDTFPTQREIAGIQDNVADGVVYEIEVATPRFYKAIRYSNPDHYNDAYNQRMAKFLVMLQEIGVFSMPKHSL
jgi:hypothetical protein